MKIEKVFKQVFEAYFKKADESFSKGVL